MLKNNLVSDKLNGRKRDLRWLIAVETVKGQRRFNISSIICYSDRRGSTPHPDSYIVWLGEHNLTDQVADYMTATIETIILHPGYSMLLF